MYPGDHAIRHPDRPAFIMAGTGEAVGYGEYEARCNRLARLLVSAGLGHRDHYAVFMENSPRFLESCGAGERCGLYYTCVNSYLTPEELAYIVTNSESRVLITSEDKRAVALEALKSCPQVRLCVVVDGPGEEGAGRDGTVPVVNLDAATAALSSEPLDHPRLGHAMLYSSGTTGQPKGILRPLPDEPPDFRTPVSGFVEKLWRYREGMIYLSPAPLYHSAPLGSANLAFRLGATTIVMERFDPQEFLALVEKYRVTHSQLVPTMFARMLKLPEEVRARYDVSSLEAVNHGAAPCPVGIKQQMIEWWGPIVYEYYGATEGLGFTACDSAEWLARPGTVGQVKVGELHILDDDYRPCPPGVTGTVWFRPATEFSYFNDAARTAESRTPDGSKVTVGDMGYVDEDGYLFLTDRSTFMIVSGGVNIYPQECENLLITHPKVADAAVFGVPDEEFGEAVKAVVQPVPDVEPGAELAAELDAFCREHLSVQKIPKSFDFEAELPRLPTGKLYKRVLRDRYWQGHKSRIL